MIDAPCTATLPFAKGVGGVRRSDRRRSIPIPVLAVIKASAPVGGGSFNLPGSDIVYTLTVTNGGAKPVDAGTIVLTDLLPPGIRFRNVVLDTTLGLPLGLSAGTSGVALLTTSAAYSNNGGASRGYLPTAGYDDAVNGLRITASGAMAGNSSFSVSFVGQVR